MPRKRWAASVREQRTAHSPKFRQPHFTELGRGSRPARQWDAGGHAVGILAPGGWIAKTDPDAKAWEVSAWATAIRMTWRSTPLASCLLRRRHGMGLWRAVVSSTRVVHAVSGSEFGWRSGTGKWPTYYADSLPPVIDIGPGSPVGVEFGYGTKFRPNTKRRSISVTGPLARCTRFISNPRARRTQRPRKNSSPHAAAADGFAPSVRTAALLHHRRTRDAIGTLSRDLHGQGIDRTVFRKRLGSQKRSRQAAFIEEGHVALTGAEPHKSKYRHLSKN